MNKERVSKVLETMQELKLSQILVTDPTSIFYLTNHYEDPFERFWGLLLKSDGGHKLIANKLFTLSEVEGVDIVWYSDGESAVEKLAEYVDGGTALGIDGVTRAKFLLEMISKKVASDFVDSSEVMKQVRACKDVFEQEKMAEVSFINDRAMLEFKGLIHEGITELEVADKMLEVYKKLGADDFSFEPLVGFGANAANGHHAPDKTVLKKGDCVLFDVGCKKNRFCADMTRTFFYKEADAESKKVYKTVLKAQMKAEAAIKPGVKLSEIDKIARDIITEAGYGEYFTHRLGHFIGYDVHEAGDVSPASEIVAKPGMIFSIEPGIYLPGKVGVRIEDLVLVTERGAQVLNHYPKDMEILN